MLDYIAAEIANVEVAVRSASGLPEERRPPGSEIPGGELAQLGDMVRGFRLAGACFGIVALDAIVDGSAIEPGDAVLGLPSSGLQLQWLHARPPGARRHPAR